MGFYLFMIPKILHFVWEGSKIPLWVKQNIEEWRMCFPDWEIKISGIPHNIPKELKQIVGDTALHTCRFDAIKYWLLFTEGGVVLDVDTRPLKKFDFPLFSDFYVPSPIFPNWINNFCLGGMKGSQYWEMVVERAKDLSRWESYESCACGKNVLLHEGIERLLPDMVDDIDISRDELDSRELKKAGSPCCFRHYLMDGYDNIKSRPGKWLMISESDTEVVLKNGPCKGCGL